MDAVAVGRDASASRAQKLRYVASHPTRMLNLMKIRSARSSPGSLRGWIARECEGDAIRPKQRIFAPHSLGSLYTMICSFIGYDLIRAFEARSGIPGVVNTSFNENEPIVEHPSQASDCFLHTKMDALVIGRFLCTRDGFASLGTIGQGDETCAAGRAGRG